MEELSLAAEKRVNTGKEVARKLRANKTVPGVIYGRDQDPETLTIPGRELLRLLQSAGSGNVIINLKVDTRRPEKVLLKEVQRHPVTSDVLHIDFLRVDPTKRLDVEIPLRIVGTAEGVKAGGVMAVVRRNVEISCLPDDIPPYIEVDVSALGINEAIHVSDLTLEKGEFVTNPERTIVTVHPPIVAKVAAAAAEEEEAEAEAEAEAGEEEAAEPEVIKEKKEEE
jgi:large subunit ribosomal protein L25